MTIEITKEAEWIIYLSEEIRKTREEKGITQEELAKLCGVNRVIINRLENGFATPNINTVLKVLIPLGKALYVGSLK